MRVSELAIPGVLLIELDVFRDERGWFQEFWNPTRMSIPGVTRPFVQDNVAFSKRGVLRGLHFQQPHAQGKLVTVVQGDVFDVAVDLRSDQPTFGRHVSMTLRQGSGQAIYIPEGFAHGYQVLSETAHVLYKCTEVYHPGADRTLAWNDPVLDIAWPLPNPVLSEKDAKATGFAEMRASLATLEP